MPEKYLDAILKCLTARDYHPLKPRQLARAMGIAEEEYGSFREAIKRLRDAGRIVLGAKNSVTLPQMTEQVVGFFRANPRGFGFVIPETPNAHGDLFIPPGFSASAMTGDLVVARVVKRGKRAGEAIFSGEITEILQRGQNRFVGTLDKAEDTWFVLPDGREMLTPIVVRDVSQAGPAAGVKVIVEILQYGSPGELPSGVIVETLGEKGDLEVETISVIRANGLAEHFSDAALEDARRAVEGFDPENADSREDLTGLTIATIDPPDARDYDDAISLTTGRDGQFTLGIHIADVSSFVAEGSALDEEARQRSTSVYFPRKVLPMLPEVLSNGVCSLQQDQKRFCKSAFITYDHQANIVSTRFAETVIRSAKRLTYDQAQQICDGQTGGHDRSVVELVQRMDKLARLIERRRRQAGMLHLDLPEVELVFDDAGRVVDAEPQNESYSHTIIEMFMVEANEAVATLLDSLSRAFLRRIHPAPDGIGSEQLTQFVQACGHRLPRNLSRRDLQDLLAKVKGRPESYAVNLAVLKTFQQAEYSPMQIGHFALASERYCHFTSPIRRYPDLTVHRLLAEHCRGRLKNRPPEDMSELVRSGKHCTSAERRAEAAADELREVLILQFLQSKIGDSFDGVITGVANFGLFVQSRQFLIEGLVRMEDLGDDWWEVHAKHGHIAGQRTGKTYRIGDVMRVKMVAVDVARRRLSLLPETDQPPGKQKKKRSRRARNRKS